MITKKKKHLQWLPFFVTVFCAIVTLIIYTLTTADKDVIVYLQVIGTAFIPLILPIVSYISKKEFPLILNVLIVLHIILAMDLGSAMNFYDSIYCWDMMMHGYFGFVASVGFYILLMKWNGEKLNQFGFYTMIFLSTMGCAAIWEIFEFVCDALLNGDAQRVQESIAMGHTPVYDTMMDIIIAIAGCVVFFVGIAIQNKLGKSICREKSGNTKNIHCKR